MTSKIIEIRIKKVSELSEIAKQQVFQKVEHKGEDFKFSGYAKLTYAEASPQRIINIEPIEGNGNDEFDRELEVLGIKD